MNFQKLVDRDSLLQELGIRIFNRGRDTSFITKDAVYVGRPSIFGNPFTHIPLSNTIAEKRVATRERSIIAYEEWAKAKCLTDHAFRNAIKTLYKRDLVCWCWPLDCHALVLARLAKEFHEEDAAKTKSI